VSSITFQSMSAATAINFVSGVFVSTFSNINFAASGITTNVNASAIGSGSRITMLSASGIRGGPSYENDPFSRVDWPGIGAAGTITALAYTAVSANSLTANWITTFPGGTLYYMQISSDSFVTFPSTVSTLNSNFNFGGLIAGTIYEVRVSTSFSGGPFSNLGSIMTPTAGGGTLNFNFFDAGEGVGIGSANGQNEMGLGIKVNPSSGDIYIIFASTPGATGERNLAGHDTTGVVAMAKYDSNGVYVGQRTLPNDSNGSLALDGVGDVYVAETDRNPGNNLRKISKYTPDLTPMQGRVISDTGLVELGPMISDGSTIFSLLEDNGANSLQLVHYAVNLVPLATATYVSNGALRGHGVAYDGGSGDYYVLVSSAATPTAKVHLLKYPPAFNATSPTADVTFPDIQTDQYPRVVVAAGKVYVAFLNSSGFSVIVREYDQSLNYTGFSSTITNVTAPFGRPSMDLKAQGPNIYVAATVNEGGGGDYLVMRYDANNGLAYVSSATYNSPTYLPDQVRAMAIGALGGDVFVTGGSSDTIANANVVSARFQMGAAGAAAGAVSPMTYTSVSTISFNANWDTTFPAGTPYRLDVSYDGFTSSTSVYNVYGTSYTFTGLISGTPYDVRVSTVASGLPYTSLGIVTTFGAGLSISGSIFYPGSATGLIKVEAAVSPAFSTIVSSQILSNLPSQPYYLPVGAGTYYLRAYVDVLGGGSYQNWFEQGTAGSYLVSASSITGANFVIAVDSIAPNSPLGLSAMLNASQVGLTWAAPTASTNGAVLQDLRGYIIQRSTGVTSVNIAGSPSAPISNSVLNFMDFNPVPNVTNFYKVVAVDFARNLSAPSPAASASGGTGGAGGIIVGHLSTFTATTSGTYRVQVSSTPNGTAIAESNQVYYSFSGLSSGTYYLRGYRDLNEDAVRGSFEPAGVFGGSHNNPYPVYVSVTNSAFGDVSICDRSWLQVAT
ncbi:MAG: hypothetical protein COV48_15660, partial [Elusimicrobia bacterium CG11_big_fil_rev_8_21_14_0_20_64_6]